MGFFNFLFYGNESGKATGDREKYTGVSQLAGLPDINNEFAMEMPMDLDNRNLMESYDSYSDKGVVLERPSNMLRLVYSGILAQNGAQGITCVAGYGNNLKWEDVGTYRMDKTSNQTYELMFPVIRDGNINMAFKDDVGNWDNNSGMNYTFSN